jgi:hypothetical protein
VLGLAAFEQAVVDAFHPKPFLPSFGFSPPPDFGSTLLVVEAALEKLPPETPLLLFVEDINRLAGWEHWQDSAISLFTAVGAKGLVIGNSSVVLAHRKFESLSHTGLRTSTFFLPSLPPNDPELQEYAQGGGHLYQPGFVATPTLRPSLSTRISTWNGNLQMIRKGTEQDHDDVLIRISKSLASLQLPPQHQDLVTQACSEDPARVLELRKEMLQVITDAPDNQIPRLHLSDEMKRLNIADHLAAMDLVTFRTLMDEASGDDYVAVAPYHPCVVTQFKNYTCKKMQEEKEPASANRQDRVD